MLPPYGFTGAYGPAGGSDAAAFAQAQHGAYGGLKPLVPVARRGGINVAALAFCLFFPWLVFVVVCTVQSFGIHYQNPFASRTITAVTLLGVLAIGFASLQAVTKKVRTGDAEPTWYVFAFLTSLIAWGGGLSCGQYNYYTNLLPYYDASNLNAYKSVDPANLTGQQFMDAGRFTFVQDAHLDMKHSMGFRNRDIYCVAPVVSGNKSLDRYDFWAVGINCCSGHEADFHCGEYNVPEAHSGLRVMNDGLRPFFRLAVQQAEAAYNLRASHPIFLYWMTDPTIEMNSYQDDGYKFFMTSIFGYLAVQLSLTAMAMVIFFKLCGPLGFVF